MKKLTIAALGVVLLLSICSISYAFPKAEAKVTNATPPSVQAYTLPTVSMKDIPIMELHAISEEPTEWDSGTISPDRFKEYLVALKENGFTPIFFKDYSDAMEGKTQLPSKPIFITFDDGYYSNYRYAYPILKEMKMKATINMIGWSVGRTTNKDNQSAIFAHFTWKEAKEMYDSGFVDLQNHTYDLHNSSDKVHYGTGVDLLPGESEVAYRKRFKADILKMKNLIESHIGNTVDQFTYPYGKWNPVAESVLKELGFKYTLAVGDGISDMSQNTYLLKRINCPQDLTAEALIQRIEAYQQSYKKSKE